MNIDISGIILLVTVFIVFGIFLGYDWFRRGEKWGYLAYIVAVIPANILWAYEYDLLGVYMVLFILWDICLLRDLLFVYRKDKEYDDIFLFLVIGILMQIIITGIAPALNTTMQTNTMKLWVFYFPDVYGNDNNIKSWVNPNLLLGFRIFATVMVILTILPMVLDLKESEEHISLLALIIIDAIFILPFLWLAYVWLGGIGWPLTLLFSVLLLIVLLLLTRER